MATEGKRGRKYVAPILPVLPVKEKVKRKVTAIRSSHNLKKLRLTENESKKSEKFVDNVECTKTFSKLSQPLPFTNKLKRNTTKFDTKHTVTRAQLQLQISSHEMNTNVSDTNDHGESINNTTKTELETSTGKNVLCPTDLIQPVNSTKDECLKCEVISTSQEVEKELQSTCTLNNTNTAQTEDKSGDCVSGKTINEDICNVNRQSPEGKLRNNVTEPLQGIGHVLKEQKTSTYNGKSQQVSSETADNDANSNCITSTILHSSQTEVCKEKEQDKVVTSQHKQTQPFLDLVNTPCSTGDTDHLVNIEEQQTNNCAHYEKKINVSKERSPELSVAGDRQEKFITQNKPNLQAHGQRIADNTSDGGCSDIVGNSQEDDDNILQLSINSNFREAEHQDILNACKRAFPIDLYCIPEPKTSLSQCKSQQIICNAADENSPLVDESNSNINETNEDNHLSDILLKQETNLHTEKLLEMENQGNKTELLGNKNELLGDKTELLDDKTELLGDKTELLGDKNELLSDKNLYEVKQDEHKKKHPHGDLSKQIENQRQNDQLPHEKIRLSEQKKNIDGENTDKISFKNQTTLELCNKNTVGQTNTPEMTPSTSLQAANLDDDLEISTSQLLKLESEFDMEAIELDSNLDLPQEEPPAVQSALPRHIRAPTIDWTQRAEHNRQRLQTIIQDICKLNAMLARARRMVWKQQPP